MSGLICPNCGCTNFRTDTTRPQPAGVQRYRVCRCCGRRIETMERVVPTRARANPSALRQPPITDEPEAES